MCGISGIVSLYDENVDQQLLKDFTDIIAHRGPDDDGFFTENNLGLGHRRLSIIDLSHDGHQPMPYLDKYVIVYNGEVYNYVELRAELIQKGYTFKSKTDTEVILAAYDAWGEGCLDRFNGMWAFIIYDRTKNSIFCARDRFGVKPLYYTRLGNYFAIASEIKQFTTLPGWKAIANNARLLDFLILNVFDHTNETLFKDVFQLKGGHKLSVDLKSGRTEVAQWYDLRSKLTARANGSVPHTDKFYSLMKDSVSLRLRSDVKVGSCLSGGLDSSTIVCLVNELLKEQGKAEIQETVSSCFDEKKYDESHFIDVVVDKTKVKSHKVYPAFPELFEKLEKITWHQDNPIGSTSVFAQWNVFKTAKENNLTVMLDGQGADESLAGYHPFYDLRFKKLLSGLRFGEFVREVSAFKKMHRYSTGKVAKILTKMLLPQALLSSGVQNIRKKKYSWLKADYQFYNPFHNLRAKDIQDYSVMQLRQSSLPMLLHYEDRNSMAFSIESRVPFLDYRLVEFILNLEDHEKIDHGKTKAILRKSLKNVVPDKILTRYDKMGFVTPETVWFRSNTRLFEEKLSEALEYFKPIIDRDLLLKAFREADQDDLMMGSVYWRIIALGMWVKAFNVSIQHD